VGPSEIVNKEELLRHGGHDAFTKFATAVAIPGKEAMHVAPALLSHFYTFGIPMQLVTDPGREYCNELEKHLWTALKIWHDLTTPYHPACNSAVETFNKILKHYIATALVDVEASTLDWEAYLAPLLFAYNTAVSSSTKVTPFEATFGYDPRVPLWEGVKYPVIKHVPGARATREQVHLTRPPPPACESTGQAQQQQQGLEDEDKLMLRRGQLRAHAEDEDGQDGPSA
jgi:hypothetical protein